MNKKSTMFSLIKFCNLNMICCLNNGVVLDHDLKASLLLLTAASISSFVDCGTLPINSFVA